MRRGPLKVLIRSLQGVLCVPLEVLLFSTPLSDSMGGLSFFHFDSKINLKKRGGNYGKVSVTLGSRQGENTN